MDGKYEQVKVDVEVIVRNLKVFTEKLQRAGGTQFEPNASDMSRIKTKLRVIKKSSADLIFII